MTARIGASCKLYYNTGTVGVPVWVELNEIVDVQVGSLEFNLAELKRRANKFTKNLAALFNAFEVTFRMHANMDATTYDQIRQDFFSQTAREWAVMNGSITTSGNEGLRMPALVNQFPYDQPLEEVVGHDIGLTVAYMTESGSEIDPSWFVVA